MDDGRPRPVPRAPRRMRVLAVAIALLPFVLVEIGLRVFSPPVAQAVDADPTLDLQNLHPLFELNEPAGRWEIPATRGNFFQPASFLAEKPPGSRRLFVLGGSTVQGRPYATETSFATWMKLQLQAAAPHISFEVVNCGGVSYASYRVAKILDEVLAHQPDAIVIYTGHNEFLEDREYAEVREMTATRRWFARIASHVRTVTWLSSQWNGDAPTPAKNSPPTTLMPGEVDARLDHIGGLKRYVRDPLWRSQVESHFAATLKQMLERTQADHVPLVVCVPSSDLVHTPPFKSELPPGMTSPQKEAFQAAWEVAINGEIATEVRESNCQTCLNLDPQHAGAHHVMGILQYQQGNSQQARHHLGLARDYDVCPLRATTPIVNTVIQLANASEVTLVNVATLFDQRNGNGTPIPDGIEDPQFFVDHVHPSILGHQKIGAQITSHIAQWGWFDIAEGADERYRQLATKHFAGLGEDYFGRGQQRLEGLRQWASGRAGQLIPPRPEP